MKSRIALLRFLIIFVFLLGCLSLSTSENVKKSIEDPQDESNEANDDTKDSMDILAENENSENSNSNNNNSNNSNNSNNVNSSSNKNNTATCTRRQNSRVHEIQAASDKQYTFMAAIMSHQNEFLCSGSVVSMGLILTSAECVQKPISYVLLNTIKAKKDEASYMLYIKNREKFPSYVGATDGTKDVGIIYTEIHNKSVATKINLSSMTSLKGISDFEALGYGLNTDVNQPKDLQSIGLEYRPFDQYPDLLEGYFDCIDTKVPTCFKDIGGPAIFDNELIGVISHGQDACTSEMSSKYAVSKKLVVVVPIYMFKAWLDEKIKKNEEKQSIVLQAYPAAPTSMQFFKPVQRQKVDDTSKGYKLTAIASLVLLLTAIASLVLFSMLIAP